MGKPSQPKRRRSRGRAWYWKQTDTWYYTQPGTKSRVRLTNESGYPIRGQDNVQAAELALARVKANGEWQPAAEKSISVATRVADVCSEYLVRCERRMKLGAMTRNHFDEQARYLNDFCGYCGALPSSELQKGHVDHWVESHATWRSPVTRRHAITAVKSAFKSAEETLSVRNPLIGLKKPPQRPRLYSFTPKDEQVLYDSTSQQFRDFLFACIHTGLRPYSELARLTSQNVVETNRGMQWRVAATKTGKTRLIPVRAEVAELIRRLINKSEGDPSRPIFRNARGTVWSKDIGKQQFFRLRKRAGWDESPLLKRYSTYTCRHTFAHRMLSGYWNEGKGCSIEVLAELMGDTPQVAFNHYGREWGQHYQAPLWSALGM
ncbi:tyrosine-type recombinase/integrase [Rubinisphaera margarita]|uniref:tyrosine-type recombinase/integrase n=1 Tax=Rubinisphaera margarita TaxID=2909586 RepID=UPI001EE8B782|nr:tyrosine-type recombinase/integrase [Rubinisphaera margarita]MCG6157273.1 tyrosine-type recombinase/integrase [Rubinisphaera margarita]